MSLYIRTRCTRWGSEEANGGGGAVSGKGRGAKKKREKKKKKKKKKKRENKVLTKQVYGMVFSTV